MLDGQEVVGVSPGPAITGDTLATWVLGPEEFVSLPALELPLGELFQFLVNGQNAGLALARGTPESVAVGQVSAYANVQGPGYTYRDIWTEQATLWFESGERFAITLVVAGESEKILIPRSERLYCGDSPDGQLLPDGVTCETLEVEESDDEFTLWVAASHAARGRHRVLMSFTAPSVEVPSLFAIGCFNWVKVDRTGHGVVRGILVRPPPAN